MSKILEFEPVEEAVIIPRILIDVHQAIDEAFPLSAPAPSRFAKTAVFGNEETTANKLVPQADQGPAEAPPPRAGDGEELYADDDRAKHRSPHMGSKSEHRRSQEEDAAGEIRAKSSRKTTGKSPLPSLMTGGFDDKPAEGSYREEPATTKWSFFIIPLSIIVFFVILSIALIWSRH